MNPVSLVRVCFPRGVVANIDVSTAVVAVWSGLALDGSYLDESRIHEAVETALDEMEFLTGDATTKWGAVRASILGHTKPWVVKYVEIGNEDWLAGRPTAYEAYKKYRFPAFLKAFTEKYPDIQIIASPSIFDDMVIPAPAAGDWHPYLTPDELVDHFDRFDSISRQNKTLIGEVAATHPNGGIGWDGELMAYPWWGGSVAEAIFLLGTERNADKVIGATYAPGLRNMNRWQWSMTQIQHAADPELTTLSTSFHVWKLLGSYPLKETLPVTSTASQFGPLYYVAGHGYEGSGIFKAAVYNATESVPVSVRFSGAEHVAAANLTILTGPANPYGYNDPFLKNNVVEQSSTTLEATEEGVFSFELPALSVAVLETIGSLGS